MRAFASAAAHGAGYGIAGQLAGVKYLIAEILECLGIAFADHLGFRIIVEDPDDAPGIHVIRRSSSGLIIVRNKLADLLKDRFQLFICCLLRRINLPAITIVLWFVVLTALMREGVCILLRL